MGEFHYLHHPPGKGRYADEAEMSRRILAAARRTGIGLVHMPVIYESGGFGGRPLTGSQQRFRLDLAGAARLADALRSDFEAAGQQLGWALHSLRATDQSSFATVADFLSDLERAPVHIHVAEQEREVTQCLARRGARPVEWLLDNAPVDARWCLVHATHVTPGESASIAGCGATVGLCPATEANLGDGLFPLADFVAGGGGFGVGTDSNVSRSAVEELRMLDYGQRLNTQSRTVLPGARTSGSPPGAADDSDEATKGAGGRLLDYAWATRIARPWHGMRAGWRPVAGRISSSSTQTILRWPGAKGTRCSTRGSSRGRTVR